VIHVVVEIAMDQLFVVQVQVGDVILMVSNVIPARTTSAVMDPVILSASVRCIL